MRAGDHGAQIDSHAKETVCIENTDISVLSVVGGKGSGGNENLIPHLRGGHLYTALDRGIEGQELGDAGLLIVENTDGGEVVLMLTLTGYQGGAKIQAIALTHLGIVDGGLNTQVQIGRGVEHGVVRIIGDTVGKINEGVDDLALGSIGHVEVHGLVGVQIVIGMERLVALKEENQLVVVNSHTHVQSLGQLFGGRSLQIGSAHQSTQLGSVQGYGTVFFLGHDAVTTGLQLTVGVVLHAVGGNGQGGAATQYFFNAVGSSVLGKIGKLCRGEVHRGDGGLGLDLAFVLAVRLGRVVGDHGFNGIGESGGVLGRALVTGGHSKEKHQEEGGDQEANQFAMFHDSDPFFLCGYYESFSR